MTDSESPPCRLYLVVPAGTGPETLAAALEGGDVACVRLEQPDDTLRAIAQDRDVACFSEAEPASGFDGVHLAAMQGFAAVRGRAAMVGVAATTRHDAMDAAEAGADYVSLSDLGMVEWWAEIMEVPCVAEGAANLDEVRAFAAAGADFIAVPAGLWSAGGDARKAVTGINAAIAAAARR
jgi:thiamine-phosphate pyrophosphorylase